jgi:CRISPR system Cascade subunit CasB
MSNQTREQTVPRRYEKEFVDELVRAVEKDRAAIASFKRAIGTSVGDSSEAMKNFYKMLPYPIVGNRTKEEIYFMVATLFSYSKRNGELTFPAAMRIMKDQHLLSASMVKRFRVLLDSKFDQDAYGNLIPGELGRRIKGLLGILKSNNINIDWAELLKDVLNWNHESRYVQKKWARTFFGGQSQTENQSRTENQG